MKRLRWRPLLALSASIAASLATACTTPQPRAPDSGVRTVPVAHTTNAGRYSMQTDAPPESSEIPDDVASVPDAVPQIEPRSASGNSPIYEVFGKKYRVLDSAKDFSQRGTASWYGKKFHGHQTASGEPYDMFKMTAAHKSLPLPSYVRVTRVDDGRSIVVRVNDRGPFHSGRIIDLSYAAASKLDMIQHGQTLVDIVALTPEPDDAPPAMPTGIATSAPSAQAPAAPEWLQLAVYADPINAVAMREQLSQKGVDNAKILTGEEDGVTVHRVVLGPFRDRATADDERNRLRTRGIGAVRLAQ
ncbi:septal ring lytic transglycosylase RlpA family protein [Sinimarinibacterium sp. CAU 1509]|uniref:septal ring lytic transglycosylase RlpA family protein n=1 Tax=Sinimarinibacterium sp. CAU 1509 TaxID=2562283 RepID=UPI0010ACE72E|nr:septal ring lytic transglycosylase RlpA family protein [Sinimarinibacterium sp. CAU 1509]TJY65194.1 septal ring lytic transglycosylase RlpA family protein [Sinimarinibacterium sp. CAU 1509]